jgi:hypothetical protein
MKDLRNIGMKNELFLLLNRNFFKLLFPIIFNNDGQKSDTFANTNGKVVIIGLKSFKPNALYIATIE